MRPMLALFFVLSISLATGISSLGKELSASAHAQEPIVSFPAGQGEPSVLEVDPAQMVNVIAQRYRLPPDRRFLLAVALIHSFFTREDIAPVKADFVDGSWHVSYLGKSVGSLPELPNFGELMSMLESWTKSLQAQMPLQWGPSLAASDFSEIQNQLNDFQYSSNLAALHKIDGLWNSGGPRPELLATAARALVSVAIQALDHLETGDQLQAKAVAVLGLAKTLTDDKSLRNECLLSYTMDYSSHAVELAKMLPEDDQARLYVLHNDQRLEKIALQDSAPKEARYLRLLRIVETEEWGRSLLHVWFPNGPHSLMAWKIVADSGRPLPELPRLVLAEVSIDANVLQGIKPDEVGLKSGGYASCVSAMILQFETILQKISGKCSGPFLDSKTYQTLYNGYFYTPLYDHGLDYLDGLSSIEAAQDFSASLGNINSGIGGDLKRWYSHLVVSKEGKTPPQALRGKWQEDFAGLQTLGLPPLMRTMKEAKKSYLDLELIKTAKAILPRLDSRVIHRWYLFEIARGPLLDITLRERLAESIIKDSSQRRPQFLAWYANYSGDDKLLRELLDAESMDWRTKLKILGYLVKKGETKPEELIERYRKISAKYPDSWDVTDGFQRYLMQIQKYEEVRSIVNNWLDRNVLSRDGTDRIDAKAAISLSYFKEGRYEEGWNVIEPEIASWKASAMEMGARLLDKLNRPTEAEKLMEACVDRYPDSALCRAKLARLYWRHGKNKEAAEFLKQSANRLFTSDWEFRIAPEFVEAFSDKPKENALAAFSALFEQGHGSPCLLNLAKGLADNGLHELAFELCSQLHGTNEQGEMRILLRCYDYLKEFKGQTAAFDWLHSKLTPPLRGWAANVAYTEMHYDMIWDLVPDPDQMSEMGSYTWLMRAAASLKLGPTGDPHRKDLMFHFENDAPLSKLDASKAEFDTISRRYQVGRFLCGLVPKEEVLKFASIPLRRGAIAYDIGLRCQSEGNYAEACRWYRAAIETGIDSIETEWAIRELNRWISADKSLERIALDKL